MRIRIGVDNEGLGEQQRGWHSELLEANHNAKSMASPEVRSAGITMPRGGRTSTDA